MHASAGVENTLPSQLPYAVKLLTQFCVCYPPPGTRLQCGAENDHLWQLVTTLHHLRRSQCLVQTGHPRGRTGSGIRNEKSSHRSAQRFKIFGHSHLHLLRVSHCSPRYSIFGGGQ